MKTKLGRSRISLLRLFQAPDCLTLELAREVFPVSHEAPPSGIVFPFEVSVKSGLAQNSSLTPISQTPISPLVEVAGCYCSPGSGRQSVGSYHALSMASSSSSCEAGEDVPPCDSPSKGL